MKITVPTDWSDITLRQYQRLAEVPDLEFDDLDKQLKILEILTGVSDDYFLKIHIQEVGKLINKTDFINNTPTYKRKPSTVKIDGRRFVVNYIPQELISGEYIDLMELTKDPKAIAQNLHKIIPRYLKPINMFGGRLKSCYDVTSEGVHIQTSESLKWTEDRIQDGLTMDLISPMNGFFLTLYQNLTKATLVYSENQMEEKMKEMKVMVEDLTSSGGGL